MKKYYLLQGDFANTYRLYWAETPEQIATAEKMGCERITRKEAERMCAMENQARRDNPAFSGYGSSLIFPIDYAEPYTENDWMNDRNLYKDGYVIAYVRG